MVTNDTFTGAGSGGNGTGVRGYMLSLNFGPDLHRELAAVVAGQERADRYQSDGIDRRLHIIGQRAIRGRVYRQQRVCRRDPIYTGDHCCPNGCQCGQLYDGDQRRRKQLDIFRPPKQTSPTIGSMHLPSAQTRWRRRRTAFTFPEFKVEVTQSSLSCPLVQHHVHPVTLANGGGINLAVGKRDQLSGSIHINA